MTGSISLFLLTMWPILGAFISYLIGRKSKRVRDYFANFVTITLFISTVLMFLAVDNNNPIVFRWDAIASFGIHLKLDGFRYIYAFITALMWMMTTIFSREYFAHYHNRNRYYFFMLLTLGATMGVFLSADLITTFIFFEIMSFTSYVMVIHDESPKAQLAAKTYMGVAVLGGLMMLMGIFLLKHNLGTTEIDKLIEASQVMSDNKGVLYLSAAFMVFGFGGKAGMYPLHIWLPNAHPVAPAPASALLSGVLTKTGVFGIIVVSVGLFFHEPFWGTIILIIGVLGMFTGAFLAVFSIDLKRTLACSSMSQIGFILVGIGMQGILGHHNALAVRGTLLHMINHSLIKLVLFMVAGVIYMNLHQLDLNKIRGFGRGKPILQAAFLMGVLGIIGMPMWNGYISKTLLHESIVEQIWLYESYTSGARFFQVVESIFTLTGGLTTAYMIKIFVAVCIEPNRYDQKKFDSLNKTYMNKASAFAIAVSAAILPFLGFFFDIMLNKISAFGQGFMHGEEPAHAVELLAWINLKGAVASLSIGAIVYLFIVRGCLMSTDENGRSVYVNIWPSKLDIETYIYKPFLLKFLPFIGALGARFVGMLPSWLSSFGYRLFMAIKEKWTNFIANMVKPEVALKQGYAEFYSKANPATMPVWEGEGDFIGALATFNSYDMKAPLSQTEEHHDDHGEHGDHGEPPEGFLQWSKGCWNRFIAWVSSFKGRPLNPDDIAKLPQRKEMSESKKVIIGSLIYSFFLLLIGFCIVLVFTLIKQ